MRRHRRPPSGRARHRPAARRPRGHSGRPASATGAAATRPQLSIGFPTSQRDYYTARPRLATPRLRMLAPVKLRSRRRALSTDDGFTLPPLKGRIDIRSECGPRRRTPPCGASEPSGSRRLRLGSLRAGRRGFRGGATVDGRLLRVPPSVRSSPPAVHGGREHQRYRDQQPYAADGVEAHAVADAGGVDEEPDRNQDRKAER
jgi:hypothetical protein